MANILSVVQNSIKNWFIPLIVGIIFVAISIYTFVSPVESYVALTVVFSIAFLVSGVAEIIFSISNSKTLHNWGWVLFLGIVTAVIGVLLLMYPEVSMITLPFFVGFVVLFRSVSAISLSLDIKSYGILDWGYLLLLGVLGVILSIILIVNPTFAAGFTVFVWGFALLIIGIISIYFGIKLRQIKRFPERISKEVQDRVKKVQKDVTDELDKIKDGIKKATN